MQPTRVVASALAAIEQGVHTGVIHLQVAQASTG
jgi:hypothetical protein